MAMINCPECGKEISDKAVSCPNCGCPIGFVGTVGNSNAYESTYGSSYQGNNSYQNNNRYQTHNQYQTTAPQHKADNDKSKKNAIWDILVAIMLFVIPLAPIGIIIMWVKKVPKSSFVRTLGTVLFGLFFLVWLMIASFSGDENNNNTEQNSRKEDQKIESNLTEDEITNDDKKETEEIKQNADVDNIFHVGDTLETKKVKLSYLSCGEYTDDNMFVEAGAGNKFVYFEFEFENIGDVDVSVGSFDFDCYADGYDAKSTMSTADNAMISITTLSPGRKTNGIVVFEVPQSAGTIEVEYETSYWTQDKAIFIYE